ncbi:unnamed protein product, partial [Nesidiocoris tenuis]
MAISRCRSDDRRAGGRRLRPRHHHQGQSGSDSACPVPASTGCQGIARYGVLS